MAGTLLMAGFAGGSKRIRPLWRGEAAVAVSTTLCLLVTLAIETVVIGGLVWVIVTVVVIGLGVLLPLGLDVIRRTSPATFDGPLATVNPLNVCTVGLGVGLLADLPFLCWPRALLFLCDCIWAFTTYGGLRLPGFSDLCWLCFIFELVRKFCAFENTVSRGFTNGLLGMFIPAGLYNAYSVRSGSVDVP